MIEPFQYSQRFSGLVIQVPDGPPHRNEVAFQEAEGLLA
jgi:hypothetical protein